MATIVDENRRFLVMATNLMEQVATPVGIELTKEQRSILHNFIGQAVRVTGLFLRRHLDYGEGNVRKIGEIGLLSRVIDKVARLENLKGREGMGESKDDSWMDIAAYAMIALIVREGGWKVEPGNSI